MGGAMLDGWLASKTPPKIFVMDRHKANDDARFSVVKTAEEIPSSFTPDIIVLAVKPAAAETAITSLVKALGSRASSCAILSVLAGKTCLSLAEMAKNAGQAMPVLRAMPNTPTSVGAGMSGFFASPEASKTQAQICHDLMLAIGEVVTVDKEEDLATVTGISGSGPAYVFLLAELLEKAAVKYGLPADSARRLARATIYGAGRMLQTLPEDAETLRKNVTSPNGTTAAALSVLMEENAWPKNVPEAVQAARKRSDELAS
ncbi:pyrroline-5-carboxylate reductase [Swingsia samuiensis]